MGKRQYKNRGILRLIFFLAGLVLAGPSHSQTWISSNATWHYNFESLGGVKGYHEISYLKDTLLNGEQCEYLQVIRQAYAPSGPPNWNYIPLEPDTLEPRFTFLRNDTVFYYTGEGFSILYCMNATAGQSWDLGVDTNELLCSRSIVHVENISSIQINGQDWPVLHVTPDPNSSVWLYGRIISRFGSYDNYLFPLPQCCDPGIAVEFDIFYFSCFQDDDFPLIQLYEDACDNPLAVGMREPYPITNTMMIFPNPASDFVHIRVPFFKNGCRSQIIVNDLYGKEKCRLNIEAEVTNLDISAYPRGIYQILLLDNDLLVASSRLIKK
jgi:hypothetical protein